MFLIDDIFLRPLGISIPGLDMIWLFEQIRDFAYKENAKAISSKIKENRMLYEFGEMTHEEYEIINAKLLRKLKLAERADEMDLGTRVDLLGVG